MKATEAKTTNQGKDMTDDEFYRAMFPDEAGEQEQQPVNEETAAKKPGRLRVKFNGEDRELSDEEAVEFAQKGMNYDKIKAALDALEKGGAKDALDLEQQLADEYGITRDEYRKTARDSIRDSKLKKEIKKIYEESPDISEALAKELAEARLGEAAKKREEDRRAKEQAPWDELLEAYPDIKSAEDLPEDAREMIGNGVSPREAMRASENASLKKQLAELQERKSAEEKNQANRAAAVGSVKGAGSSEEEIDDFLAGLYGR